MGNYTQVAGAAILARLPGCRPTTPNLLALQAWSSAEGGTARFNFFNTEKPMPGSTKYNPQGVQNYPTLEIGIEATVDTLLNGLYKDIIAALVKGDNAYDVAYAIAESPWGTGYGVVSKLNSYGQASTLPAWYHGRPYEVGSTGAGVRTIQAKVAATVDGVFGPLTKAAVIRYQTAHHLLPDGIVGPATARVMGV